MTRRAFRTLLSAALRAKVPHGEAWAAGRRKVTHRPPRTADWSKAQSISGFFGNASAHRAPWQPTWSEMWCSAAQAARSGTAGDDSAYTAPGRERSRWSTSSPHCAHHRRAGTLARPNDLPLGRKTYDISGGPMGWRSVFTCV